MEDARQAALKENAQEAYLALSKTYEEPDLIHAMQSSPRPLRLQPNSITVKVKG